MNFAPLIGFLLVAAPAAPSQIKLASPGLSYVNVDPAAGDFFLDYFAKQIELRGVRVTTNREIAALVGFERQKQLLNCGDGGTSCLAELAGALGVDGLITGSLAKVGNGYVINLKVVDNEARTLAIFSERLKSDEALLDWLTSASEKLVIQLKQALKRDGVAAAPKTDAPKADAPRLTPQPQPSTPEPVATAVTQQGGGGGGGSLAWIPAAAGGALLAGGVVTYVMAKGIENRLVNDPRSITNGYSGAVMLKDQGETLEILSWGLAGAGVAGLGLAGVLMLTAPSDAPRVSVMPAAQGATVMVGGTF